MMIENQHSESVRDNCQGNEELLTMLKATTANSYDWSSAAGAYSQTTTQ